MERKEPTITSAAIDSEAVDAQPQMHKELHRGQSNHKSPQVPPASSKAQPKSRPAPVYQPKSSGGGFVAGLALVIAIAAMAGGGYLAWQLEQKEATLLAADARIQELEKRLDFTDEESTQSVGAIRAKLKWADAEIRKLWGVSYDTNRKSIKANTTKLKSIERKATAASKAGQSAKKLADGHEQQLQSLKKLTSADTARIAEAVKNLESQRKRLQEAVDKANKANDELTRLRNDLGSRVKNNEEAIEAIDASRVRFTREINELKQRAGLQ